MSVKALIVDPEAPNAMRFAEVEEPTGGPTKVLIEVHHVSLNHGDLNDARSGRIPPDGVLGSDAAGVVTEPARDPSGPEVGARVVALAQGAFAERIAVDFDSLAEVPDSVHLAEAAALPVAGLAALRALRAAGPLLGRRVLITGASGGVGRFAVQLAARAGARSPPSRSAWAPTTSLGTCSWASGPKQSATAPCRWSRDPLRLRCRSRLGMRVESRRLAAQSGCGAGSRRTSCATPTPSSSPRTRLGGR